MERYASKSFIPGRASCSSTECSALMVPTSMRLAPTESRPQRANDPVHIDLVLRDQNAPASHQQGLLWCRLRHTVGSHLSHLTVGVALAATKAPGAAASLR